MSWTYTFKQHDCLPDASLWCLHFSCPPQAWKRAIAALGCSGGGINRLCSQLLAPLWSSEERCLLRGGTPFEEGYFLGRGYLRRGSPCGKGLHREVVAGRGWVFLRGAGSPQRRSPQGRSLSRGRVSPREEIFQGRVSTEEGFPRARVSLADAGGSRKVLCQAAPTRQQESMQHNQLPGGLQRSLGPVRESLALPQLSCQGWGCLSPLEALAGIPPQPTSTLVIPLPPLPFNRTADKLNTAGITAICSGYRCRY